MLVLPLVGSVFSFMHTPFARLNFPGDAGGGPGKNFAVVLANVPLTQKGLDSVNLHQKKQSPYWVRRLTLRS